ncbi:hypothetical protein M9Y10_030334 [Tritrichomonas musculus]|uniref:Tetraspanin family protein n=1 Tax=Tritrichomonas musculus TaxID=1915356 RepID=A0ABR2KRP1_9EUKA
MNSIDEDGSGLSDSYGSTTLGTRQILCLVFGCLCIVIGIVDMIVFYVVPTNMAKNNKKKYIGATFSESNKAIIALHFVLHSFLILFGVTIIIYGFIDNLVTLITMCVVGFLVLVFWMVLLGISVKKTFSPKSQVNAQQMQEIINNKKPIDFLFVYSRDTESYEECRYDSSEGRQICTPKTDTCYSRRGIKIPVVTTVPLIPDFNFSDIPDLLFFTLTYDIDMTSDMKNKYDKIDSAIKKCDHIRTKKVVEYHPERNGTYIISKTKVPRALKQPSRIASLIFGTGAFYEIYSKSFPSVSYTVTVNTAADQNTNYDDLAKNTICSSFGSCSRHNRKPKP